jgi:membrane protein DedA with SNARE-associated domain
MAVHPSWRLLMWLGAAVLGLAVIGLILELLADGGKGLLDEGGDATRTYFAVAALVYGDAVIAILPGETTLNTASVLATDGDLELALVILAGFLGAWLGDNTLYWIARSVPALHSRVEAAQENPKFKSMIEQLHQSSTVLVIVCRFLPFVRWGVVAGMGALPMPYGRFLLASTIGAAAWSTYTCLMAAFIGVALADYPLASVVLACVSSGILVGIGYMIYRRVHKVAAQGDAEVQQTVPQ